jgi:hypothetical protein
LEYKFKCKPSFEEELPCIAGPYHNRLDWQIWFAAMSTYHSQPWLFHLVVKLLRNDPTIISMIKYSPFQGEQKPTFIRAERYRFTFTKIQNNTIPKRWWIRKRIGSYLPPISLKDPQIHQILQRLGWS